MEPKLMMVAVYHGTKTHANVVVSKRAVLQLLSEELAPVVRVCGHLSGTAVDKIARLRKRYEITTVNDTPIFAAAAGYMELKLQNLLATDGDHHLAIFAVVNYKNLHDNSILTTDYLRAQGLLR
jgi:flavin reductase (DIM6/NTAB) family NADH-FMN oxidoreductase RutF